MLIQSCGCGVFCFLVMFYMFFISCLGFIPRQDVAISKLVTWRPTCCGRHSWPPLKNWLLSDFYFLLLSTDCWLLFISYYCLPTADCFLFPTTDYRLLVFHFYLPRLILTADCLFYMFYCYSADCYACFVPCWHTVWLFSQWHGRGGG